MDRFWKTVWFETKIRTQAMIAIGVINLIALTVVSMIFVANARKATQVEMDASVELARNFVRVALQSLPANALPEDLSKRASQLASHLRIGKLRHVRIFLADASGSLVEISPQPNEPRNPGLPLPAPSWFERLVEPQVV